MKLSDGQIDVRKCWKCKSPVLKDMCETNNKKYAFGLVSTEQSDNDEPS